MKHFNLSIWKQDYWDGEGPEMQTPTVSRYYGPRRQAAINAAKQAVENGNLYAKVTTTDGKLVCMHAPCGWIEGEAY